MRIIIMALGALSLASCSTPHVSAGTSAGGIIGGYGWQPAKSLMLANEYCKKYGKVARVSSENDLQDHMMFACVAP